MGLLPKIFDQDPELKKRLESYLAALSPERKKADMEKFEKFVAGEMTWAEIKGYPRELLKEIARIAYVKFQTGDLVTAESLFKGLSIIDHTNWYYRAALGAIFQKQKLFEQAVDEYSMALSLQDNEITSLTNRGECYMHLSNFKEALIDFETAIQMASPEKNQWSKRAKVLRDKLTTEGHADLKLPEGK